MNRHMSTIAQRAAVGLHLGASDLAVRIENAARRRGADTPDHGERGAQAAEYAMLGGVSAAACTGLVALFKNRDTLRSLVDAVISTLAKVIEGWF